MSVASGVGGGFSPSALQQLQQYLFNKIDTNSDGSVSQGELESAVTNAGGSTQSADALYSLLDPNNSGGFTEQQFAQVLPGSPLSDGMQGQLIGYQAQGWPGEQSTQASPVDQIAQSLFSQIDANGDGSISQSELETAVTNSGGTKQAADALYAQLDPNGTGSVSEQQFAQGLSQSLPQGLSQPAPHGHHHHHHGFGAPPASATDDSSTDATDGSSADDALTALFDADGGGAGSSPTQIAQNIFSSIDTNGDGSITQAELEQAVTGAGGTTAGADALYAQLDQSGTGSVSQQQFLTALQPPAPSGNTATDALLALFNSVDPTNTAGTGGRNSATATSSTSTSTGGSTAQDAIATLLQSIDPQTSVTPTTGSDTGNSAQDALMALLKGDTNTTNGSAATAFNAADIAQVFALYQSQLSQQFAAGLGTSANLNIV